MSKKSPILPFLFLFLLQLVLVVRCSGEAPNGDVSSCGRALVTEKERRILVSTEDGEISAVEISDGGVKGAYHLHFITLEPNALFLPALLHADMVIYVATGSGSLSWTAGDGTRGVRLSRGDVYRIPPGTVFFLQSNLEPEREKLRIYAIFDNSNDYYDPSVGVYSGINDMVLGFDKKVLQAAFKVSEEEIEAVLNTTKVPAIVHASKKMTFREAEARMVKTLFGLEGYSMSQMENKRKEFKAFNILKEKPDFKNSHGWSSIVTKKRSHAFKGSNIGVFMVNLTRGSMMGPHWNPMAAEMGIAIQGRGMVRAICSSSSNANECKNMRFRTQEGDVFLAPRFHPMAQMSFSDGPFVFMGFTTTTKRNHPQFLAGKRSVLRVLDREVVATSFNVPKSGMDKLLESQDESIIFDCISCAEEEESLMKEEEAERKREEEEEKEREKEEEERRKEEEERKKEREEEERKRKEEEEKEREREEEERKREEEEEKEREREEEEREEEERRRKEEEEKEREREEEEREEEERRRKEEEEKEREIEEEEEEKEREREEEDRKREKEEEEKRRREEEEKEREGDGQGGKENRETQKREENEKELAGGGKEEGTRVLLKKIYRV